MAEVARSVATAATAAHVDVALVSASEADGRGRELRFASSIGTTTPHPVSVVCVNANETVGLLDGLGPDRTSGRYTIGFWFWELSRFPAAWLPAIDRVDEIWAASAFVRETIVAATSKPVSTVGLVVDATPGRAYSRREFGLRDDAFTFLFTFNFNSYAARKNPIGLITAFRDAFPRRNDGVALVLKPSNVDRVGDRMRPLLAAIDGDPRITVIDRYLARDEIFGLESVVDSYVSLHRSEGFGLGLAEAMFLGKPVIGTAYSGNLAFMNASNSFLLDYQLVPVGAGEYPYPEGQVWAEPDRDQAIEVMRRLVDDPVVGYEVGARARADMRSKFNAAVIGAALSSRLGEILPLSRRSGAGPQP